MRRLPGWTFLRAAVCGSISASWSPSVSPAAGAAVNPDAYFLTLLACMHGAILLLISGQKLAVPREVFLAELIATATEVFNRCP